jgi:hypothetical protein
MGYTGPYLSRWSFLIVSHTEDQQRINTFSKLNTRVRSLSEKMNSLKVSNHILGVFSISSLREI